MGRKWWPFWCSATVPSAPSLPIPVKIIARWYWARHIGAKAVNIIDRRSVAWPFSSWVNFAFITAALMISGDRQVQHRHSWATVAPHARLLWLWSVTVGLKRSGKSAGKNPRAYRWVITIGGIAAGKCWLQYRQYAYQNAALYCGRLKLGVLAQQISAVWWFRLSRLIG